MYEMELRFKLTMGFKEVNEIAHLCGFKEKLVAKDAITVTMKQTVPFIPNEETIKQYAEVIKKGYNGKELTCEECVFDGYTYIREI